MGGEMTVLQQDLHDALCEYLQSNNDGMLLFEVFRRAGQYKLPIPEDAYHALNECLRKYQSGECRTLDEAFNVKRQKSRSRVAVQTRLRRLPNGMSVSGEVFHMARSLNAKGLPLGKDSELWERVGNALNLSPATAFNIYHEVKHRIS